MLTAEENVALPLSIAGEKPEKAFFEDLLEARRARRPAPAPPGRALGRPAAARRDRPRARLAADGRARRRADRQPRLRARATRSSSCSGRRREDYGQTTVMVTHDAAAAAIADRILFLADGLIADERRAQRPGGDPRRDEPDLRLTRDPGRARRVSLGRKLRALLTALAIVLGVAMVRGTFVLTDTIKKGFDTIFTVSYQNADAVVTGKTAVRQHEQHDRALRSPSRCSRRSRALPGVAGRRRRGRVRPDAARRPERQVDLDRRRAEPRLQHQPARSALQPADARRRALAGRLRTRSRSTRTPPASTTTGRSADRRVRARPDEAVPHRRHRRARAASRRSAARRSRSSTCPPRSRSSTRWASSTRSASRRRRDPDAEAARRDPLDPAADGAGADGRAAGEAGRERHDLVPLVPAELPARVRLHRALRRRVRDREHALDHDRPADARARDAADDRRDAAPGARLGAPRVARDRRARLDHRALRRACSSRRASTRSSSAVGIDLPKTGTVFATRTVVVSLAIGIIVTLLASLWPAYRATRVPPIAAVREGSVLPPLRFARFAPLDCASS